MAYFVLNLLDLLTTAIALAHGAREQTALYAALFAAFPFAIGAALKLVMAALFAFAAGILACAHPTPYPRAILRFELSLLDALLALTVLLNLHTLTAQFGR